MALTTEQVLKVSTLEAVQNVTNLKNNISELKRVINGWTEETEEDGKKVVKTFQGLTIGSAEYKQAVQQLQENQAALRNAMYGTAASLDEVKKAAKGTTVQFQEMDNVTGKTVEVVDAGTHSYNELVRTLAKLKQEWRATEDQATRDEIGKKINAVNNSLKKMDASVGVYSRNVGMYANVVDQLGNSFMATAGNAGKMIAPIKGATAAMKAMSATPVIAILGILANVLDRIISATKSSEEGMKAMTASFGAFEGIGTAVAALFQKLGEGLGWLSEKFMGMLESLDLVSDRMKEGQAIAQEEIRIAEQARDTTMKNAEAQRDIAELRAQAADKEKYTAQERIAFLEKATSLEEGIAERSRKAAEDEYNLVKRRNAQTKSSTAELKEEADAYAKMIQADTDYQNAVRRNTAEIVAARREAAAQEKQRQREAAAAAREAARKEKERLREEAAAEKAKLDLRKSMAQQELDLLAEGSAERLAKQKDIAALEMQIDANEARAKIKDKEDLDKQLELLEAKHNATLEKLDRDYALARRDQMLQAERNRVDAMEAGSAEALQATIALRKLELDTLARLDGESDAEYEARRIAAQNALKQVRLDFAEWEMEQEATAQENRLQIVKDSQTQEMENEVALREWQLQKVREYGRKEGETEAEFRARELAAEKAFYSAKKAQRDLWLNTMLDAAGAVSGILGSIADMYEANTEMTEREAKKAKALRIAAATIDMLQGVVTAVSQAMSLGPVLGPIMAAVNSAAVVAAGIANIAKMKAQQVSANASADTGAVTPAIPAVVDAPSVVPEVRQVRNVTTASEEDRLNRMADDQRVYILSSDLEAERNATQVRVRETTF